MTKKHDKFLIYFSVFFYLVCTAVSIYGTFNDLEVNMALFNPQSSFAVTFEAFGQSVLWLMWGPLFTVLFLTRHTLEEYTAIFSHFLPFIKPIKSNGSKNYKAANKIINILTGIIFFALCVIGWKKPVQNILKHMFDIQEVIYIAISVFISALFIMLFSRIDKKTLSKLEYLAAAGLLLGLCLRLAEKIKPFTHRVRFREMVAYSNGILDENSMSHGTFTKLSPVLKRGMEQNADLSAFTRWYRIGDDMGRYAKADSFPSGHVMNSTAIFLSYIFCRANEKLHKIAPFMLFFSAAYVSAMALSRIIAGAHYLTDVSFGLMVGYTVFLLADAFLNFSESRIKG